MYQVGDIVQGKVEKILTTHFIVDLKTDWKGLVHVSKISDYFVSNIGTMFHVGERYYFEVIDVDDKEKRVKLSWKSIMPRFVKDPFEFNIEETAGGFKNLKDFVEKEVENA